MNFASTTAGRTLMGDSLGFHLLFVTFGVGLPLLISALEFWAIKTKNNNLREEVRRLSEIGLVLIVAGVISGTIIAIQLTLMWSGLIKFSDKILGLPFSLEGNAFILEAVFLAYYASTWKKIKGWKHWLLGLPVVIGSLLSAIFITMANSWMNHPAGFRLEDGRIVDAQPWSGLLTRTSLFMTTHSILGYILVTCLCVMAGYGIMARRNSDKQRRALAARMAKSLAVACLVLTAGIAVIGHLQTQYLSTSQPRKFAALESVAESGDHQPYVLGGHINEQTMKTEGGLRIPNMLSLLAGNSPNKWIKGLNEYPKSDWPLLIIAELFEIKMLFVGALFVTPLLYLLALRFKPKLVVGRAMTLLMILTAISGFIVLELGWMVTELGRQPFAVNGYLRTTEAYSGGRYSVILGAVFPTLFLALLLATTFAVKFVIKRQGREK